MKKFIIGLLCGLIISATTAFAASPEVKVLLFPATVNFDVHGKISTLDRKEVDILNYNNQIYVPLRLFAEKMGALVQYNAPQTPDYMAHINVSLLDTDIWTLTQNERYVVEYEPLQLGIIANKSSISAGNPIFFSLSIVNSSDKMLQFVDPIEFLLEIKKEGEVIWSTTTKALDKPIPGNFNGYRVNISWDQKDRMGNSVPPGDYIVELKGPLTFEYHEADEVKVFTQNSGLKTRDSFTIK